MKMVWLTDGCAEHIQLLSDSLLYRPTPATLPLLQKALTDISQPTYQQRTCDYDSVCEHRAADHAGVRLGAKNLRWVNLEVLEITKR